LKRTRAAVIAVVALCVVATVAVLLSRHRDERSDAPVGTVPIAASRDSAVSGRVRYENELEPGVEITVVLTARGAEVGRQTITTPGPSPVDFSVPYAVEDANAQDLRLRAEAVVPALERVVARSDEVAASLDVRQELVLVPTEQGRSE
jgi:hypothetical protein